MRDRRLALGIPAQPARWRSHYNVSLAEFSALLAAQANQSFYPSSINTYRCPANESRFSLVFLETAADLETWMAWGLNETAAVDMVTDSSAWFKPVMSLGYENGTDEEFYLQFVKKRPYEL